MIQDFNCIFSGAIAADGTRTAQAITAPSLSTNIVDTRLPGTPALADIGVGASLWLVVQVLQTFNNLTSLTITLESDSASSLAVSPVVHFSKTIALAGLTAGVTAVRVPLAEDDYKRYLAVRYTVNGAFASQGSVVAYMSNVAPSNTVYPSRVALDV